MSVILILSGIGVGVGLYFMITGMNNETAWMFVTGMLFAIAFGCGGFGGVAATMDTPLTIEMYSPNSFFVDDHYLVVIWEDDDKTHVLTTKKVEMVQGAIDKEVMVKKSYGYNHYGVMCNFKVEIFVGEEEEIKEELANNERDTEESR